VEASRTLHNDIAVSATETEALEKAIEMENKGRALYLELSEKASNPTEKRLYAMLAEWELGHANYIQDYFNYFQDHGMFTGE
jgi:rubrerythrin